MKTATKEALSVGDRVCLTYAPDKKGVIVDVLNKAQWLVAFDSGKAWIHHSTDLVLVES